jgi:hypothetical protein
VKRKPSGHPARQDTETERLFRAMRTPVELVQTLDGKLTPERMLELKAATLGLMWCYSELAGLPAPDQILGGKP